jgi:hypothetical protein
VDADGIIRTTTSANDATSNPSAVQRLLSVVRELVGVEGLGALIGVLGFPP